MEARTHTILTVPRPRLSTPLRLPMLLFFLSFWCSLGVGRHPAQEAQQLRPTTADLKFLSKQYHSLQNHVWPWASDCSQRSLSLPFYPLCWVNNSNHFQQGSPPPASRPYPFSAPSVFTSPASRSVISVVIRHQFLFQTSILWVYIGSFLVDT